MAQSAYLTAADAALYGPAANASAAQIAQASTLIDAYLRRPKGLVYLTDANGNPAMMAAAPAMMTYTLTAAIEPGQNVNATLNLNLITPDFVGEVLVLDPGLETMEACQVNNVAVPTGTNISIPGTGGATNSITLSNVQFPHAAGAVAQTGLTLIEEKSLPSKRSVTMLSELPAVNLVSLLGRYAYGRRSDQVGGLYQEMNLLASIQSFGGPPQWIIVDTEQASISPRMGELWVPAGMLLAYYSDVRAYYIAGWTAATLPPAIKTVTAGIITALGEVGIPQSVQSATAASSTLKKFTASIIDTDMQRMIDPYAARLLY
jgi:hypothetical protein